MSKILNKEYKTCLKVVYGKKYNAIMNPMNYLDDKEIADVLNYVRNSWGNKYPIVTPAQVKAERK